MKKVRITMAVLVVLVVVTGAILWVMRDRVIQALLPVPGGLAERYPMPATMPAAVSTSVEDLLAKYEAILKDRAPEVFAVLQPGLSETEVDALEQKHGVKLTLDLRALYRWHNGSTPGVPKYAFPVHDFIPLDMALAKRDQLIQSVEKGSSMERTAFQAFAGHTKSWVGVIVDPAGDGYFYDPERSESQGSFFFNFKEDGDYVFYPRFANYLMSVIDGFETGIHEFTDYGASTADYAKERELRRRFGWTPIPS